MLEKLKDAGCAIDLAKQFVCEQCPVNGAWDADRNEVVLCENSIYSDAHAADVITHELVWNIGAHRVHQPPTLELLPTIYPPCPAVPLDPCL